MKIGISGANGHLGLAVLSELQQHGAGHEIVGISRTFERNQTPVESRDGDYDEPETLTRAYTHLDRPLLPLPLNCVLAPEDANTKPLLARQLRLE